MQKEFKFTFKPSRTCRRCGRALHDRQSIERGMGMICYLKSCHQLDLIPAEGKHGRA